MRYFIDGLFWRARSFWKPVSTKAVRATEAKTASMSCQGAIGVG
jgi:hypothetical protein